MKIPNKDITFVSIQFVLFFIYLFDVLDRVQFSYELKMLGAVLSIMGVLFIIISILQLNKSLSPFPTPKSDAKLHTNGLYAIVRHPIYTGIFISGLGYGLYRESFWKVLISIALLILFHFKSKYEEDLLMSKFEEYRAYKSRTGRLLPKIFGLK